jgi:hypothetical protein
LYRKGECCPRMNTLLWLSERPLTFRPYDATLPVGFYFVGI